MGLHASLSGVGAALVATAAIVSCGPSRPPFAPEHAAAAWTNANGFGPPMVAAARVMFDVLEGRPYDEGWNCADPSTDIRATKGEDKGKIVALGTKADLVLAAMRMTFDAPAQKGIDPATAPDYPGTGPARVFVQGYAMIAPDGHVSWAEASSYLSALEDPNKDHAALTELARPLGSELTRFIGGLTSDACSVPIMTADDLARLPYPLDRDERDIILSKLSLVAHALPRTCKVAAEGGAPWGVHFSHVEAIYRSGDSLAKARSKLSIYNGAVCLGPVEVVAVTSTQ
jgi:hypothetical protein